MNHVHSQLNFIRMTWTHEGKYLLSQQSQNEGTISIRLILNKNKSVSKKQKHMRKTKYKVSSVLFSFLKTQKHLQRCSKTWRNFEHLFSRCENKYNHD